MPVNNNKSGAIKRSIGYPERFNTDSVTTTSNEAIFLVAHNLRMAALFFQNIPEGAAGNQQVIDMLTEMSSYRGVEFEDPAVIAGKAFIQTISKVYEEME